VGRETRGRALSRVLVGKSVTKTGFVAKKANCVPVPWASKCERKANLVAMMIGNHEEAILSGEANLRSEDCGLSLEGPEFRYALTVFSTMDPATL